MAFDLPDWELDDLEEGETELSSIARLVPGNLVSPRFVEDIIAIGTDALNPGVYVPTSNGSLAIGYRALAAATSGDGNIAIGNYALDSATTGGSNLAVGISALAALTSGTSNVAVGNNALSNVTTGVENVAIGRSALFATNGSYNVAIGPTNTLATDATGIGNVAIGYLSMAEHNGGQSNTAVGTESLYSGIHGDAIVDGNFDGDAGSLVWWTVDSAGPSALGNGWAWTSGQSKIRKDSNGTGVLTPALPGGGAGAGYLDYGVGAYFYIEFEILDYTAGTVAVSFGGAALAGSPFSGNGVKSVSLHVPTVYDGLLLATTLRFTPSNASRFSLKGVRLLCQNDANSEYNTAIGNGAGYMTASAGAGSEGSYNTWVGINAGRQHTTGIRNTVVGAEAFKQNGDGHRNTVVGSLAGYKNNSSSGNVLIGYGAGHYETGSNKLFIDNALRASEADARTKALLYGVFDAVVANQQLTINAALKTAAGISPYGRSTPDNEWISFTPTVTTFGGGTFSGYTVQNARYSLNGKKMKIHVRLFGAAVAGTVQIVRIQIPASAVSGHRVNDTFPFSDNGTPGMGALEVASGGTVIELYKDLLASTNWAVSVASTTVSFSAEIEIQ